jgi:hypothetical protein
MRWLVLVASLAACETTPVQTNPLDGGISCGTSMCGDNEVCVDHAAGIDAGPGPSGSMSCFTVPRGCYIFNCGGVSCAPCMQALCAPTPVQVAGRNVDCAGQ